MSSFENLRYEDNFPLSNKIKRLVWNLVFFVLFRSTPSFLFNRWRVFLLKSFGAKIGTGCIIYPSCKIWAPWNLEMGDFSVLGQEVDCYSMDKITIGSKVAVSQRTFLCTGSHSISSLKRPLKTAPITISNHAWVCAEAFVGPGVSIGEGAVVAARAVVVKDIEAWDVVAGNPAVVVKRRITK